ncbi:Potassium channel subfamily K member 4 [Amphibalanus amphitrite]|uniref:Potassium channel subfamily K member 4 n=1 Tax=Amphibalanus amphitrite TaxID=1232801 RepID=A0A6A4X0S2_AMPAM|nr:Potassium channel subfamily K member 4 [Amphibalanus amphitrite]
MQSSFTYDQPKSLLQRFLKALSGAYIFIEIELPNEEHRYLVKRLRAKDIDDTMGYVARLFWFEKHQNLTEKQWSKKMRITLKIMETQIINAVSEHHYDGHVQTWNYDWTFPKALLFTCSIVTTLGYGHIFPHTDAGQVFTIIYATLGIPLMLLFLARIGDLMASGFRRVYRTRRYQSEAIFGKKAKRVWEDEIGQEEYMPTNQVRVPVAILMVLMLLYLLLGAQIFSVWEGWTYIAACYFSFVTLTTIGFGDLLPGNSFFTEPDDAERAWQMVTAIVYCLLGMALVSMCLQMVQQQAADLVRWAGEELGLIDDHLRPRLRYRRSKPGSCAR